MTEAADFFAEVSSRSDLSIDDAREMTEDFLKALPGFVDRPTWDLIAGLTPVDVSVDWEEVSRRDGDTVEDFLIEMSSEEKVESRRAAEHARAVAETIRSRASPGQIEALQASIEDETLLALFETERGELTSADVRERPEEPT